MNIDNVARMLLYPCIPRYLFTGHDDKVRQIGTYSAVVHRNDWFYFDKNAKGLSNQYTKILIIRESDYAQISQKRRNP